MIVGHCRFSWVGFSDTGRLASDLERARSILWDPLRMATRFWLFEKVLLPSLQNQTDQDFIVSLLISEDFPQQYRDRLENLVSENGFLRLHPTSKTEIDQALREQVSDGIREDSKEVHFRIDDDDGVSSKFIERLRSIQVTHNLAQKTAISFPRCFMTFIDRGVAKQVERFNPYHAAGLAFVVGRKWQTVPFAMQHGNVGKRMRSYVDPTFHSANYVRHAANSSSGFSEAVESRTRNLATGSPPRVGRIIKSDKSLISGAPISPSVEKKFNDANFGYDSETLRSNVAMTLNPARIAEEYGFL